MQTLSISLLCAKQDFFLAVKLAESFSLTLQLISGSCDSGQGLPGHHVPCGNDGGQAMYSCRMGAVMQAGD